MWRRSLRWFYNCSRYAHFALRQVCDTLQSYDEMVAAWLATVAPCAQLRLQRDVRAANTTGGAAGEADLALLELSADGASLQLRNQRSSLLGMHRGSACR